MSYILKNGRDIRSLTKEELETLATAVSRIIHPEGYQFNEWHDVFEIMSSCRFISEVDKWDILRSEFILIKRDKNGK